MDDGELAVPEGFDLVANETRARILYALSRAMRDDPQDPSLEFAALRRRAGVRDSGNFSYHLEKLEGHFLQETEEGYALTYPGLAVVAAIVGAEHDATETYGPEPYDEPCPICGADVVVTYERGLLRLACEADDDHGYAYNLPPHAVDPDRLDDAAELMARRANIEVAMLFEGRCPQCFGEVTLTVIDDTPQGFHVGCDRCGTPYQLSVAHAAAQHPDVVAFLAEHDVDLGGDPIEYVRLGRRDAVERTGGDPVRFEVTIDRGGDALVATVDEDANVVDVRRG